MSYNQCYTNEKALIYKLVIIYIIDITISVGIVNIIQQTTIPPIYLNESAIANIMLILIYN